MKHKRGILSGIYQGILRSGVRRREVLSRLNRDRTISTIRTSCINQGGKIVWVDEGLTTGNPGGFRGSSFGKLEGNIDQSPGNQGQGEGDHRSGIGIPNINHDFSFDRFFNLKAINKLNIPSSISSVKTNKLNGDLSPKKLGTTNATPNQPAERLTNNSEISKNQSRSTLNIRDNDSKNNQLLSTAEWTKIHNNRYSNFSDTVSNSSV